MAYRKGTWALCFDTSHWIEVGTDASPRIFDVPVPEPHLCATDDKLRATAR